jgi:hypothetical protein
MKTIVQTLDEIIAQLSPLNVDWQDETAQRVIEQLNTLPIKNDYTVEDLQSLLDKHYGDALLIFRLFLALSKDQFEGLLPGQLGIKRYMADKAGFSEKLVSLGLLEAMRSEINRPSKWSDVLVERLRSGRGSAVSGQRRGRQLEDFAENIVEGVFGRHYDARCTFLGQRKAEAKCDFAIPSKLAPRILIEVKAYAATGSKMTDVIGDIEQIIKAKRSDTAFLLLTDGVTWQQRKSDLRKIVGFQNEGNITRIYTYAMGQQLEADLRQLKEECGL